MLHHTTYTKGKDAHWVAFVHGAGGSSSIWYKQIRSFQDRFNILLVDLRGHGESKSPHLADAKAPYTFEAIAQEVLDVVDHLNIKSAHFVGISLGTIIVREIAELRPDKVRSMILAGAVMKMNVRGKVLMRFGVWFKTLVPYLLLYKFFAFIIMPRKQDRESLSRFIREARQLAQKEFIRWFRLAAEQGHLKAMYSLGMQYDMGQGLEQNHEEAARLFRQASNQGLPEAQVYLGVMYDKGLGVEQNYREAIKWYRQAAAQGNATAQYNLGLMYDKGKGVLHDYKQAVRLLRQAADQGNLDAQVYLGVKYNNTVRDKDEQEDVRDLA